MATHSSFVVGDIVELRDSFSDTVGTVIALVRGDQVKVEWNTGEGYAGKTTMLSVRALRKRPAY
jgi:hypothetical protein